MTWAEKNAGALDNAAAQILQHGIPRVIRTAGNISECACGGCQLARALIAAKAEIERLTRERDAAHRVVEELFSKWLEEFMSNVKGTPGSIWECYAGREFIAERKRLRAALQPAPDEPSWANPDDHEEQKSMTWAEKHARVLRLARQIKEPTFAGDDGTSGLYADAQEIANALIAAGQEIERLEHDLTRHIEIATTEATEAATLRAEVERLRAALGNLVMHFEAVQFLIEQTAPEHAGLFKDVDLTEARALRHQARCREAELG